MHSFSSKVSAMTPRNDRSTLLFSASGMIDSVCFIHLESLRVKVDVRRLQRCQVRLYILSVGVVFTGVSSTRLQSVGSGNNSLHSVRQQVSQFQSLHEIAARKGVSMVSLSATFRNKATHVFQIILLSLMPTLSKLL